MPGPTVPAIHRRPSELARPDESYASDNISHVHISADAEEAIAKLHRVLSGEQIPEGHEYPEVHRAFSEFLHKENKELERYGLPPARLGVCFDGLSTWGAGGGHAQVKTLKDALWRTLTGQDIYEWTIGRLFQKPRIEDGRHLIRDFSGVVRGGEIML